MKINTSGGTGYFKPGTFFNTENDIYAPMANNADISVILDKSSSMLSVKDDTIDGYNEFLDEQQNQPGNAVISLYQFSTDYVATYKALSIDRATQLNTFNYIPSGMTALNDAIGKTIDDVGARLDATPEFQRPKKVIIVIMTDGGENASTKYESGEVAEMIKHQKEVYNWEFLFIGANQDAIATGKTYNIPATHSINYVATDAGIGSTYRVIGNAVTTSRLGNFEGFSKEDRSKAMGEDNESVSGKSNRVSKSSK